MDLLVIGPYGEGSTGTSTVVSEVVKNFSEDISILVLVPRKRRESYLKDYQDGNIQVVYQAIGSIPKLPGSNQHIEILRLGLRLQKISFRPDLVWIHSATGYLAYSFSKFRHVPSVATIHGVWGEFYREEIRSSIAKILLSQSKWFQEKEINGATWLTTYSSYLKSLIKAKNPNAKVRVIPNGVNTDIFKPLNLPRDKSILYVGRMAKIKGIHHLIQSMETVLQEYPDWRLRLAGGIFDQPLSFFEKYMTPGTKPRIDFMGRVPYDNIPELLNQSSIFVMPTIRDGFEIALMEAMATGIPCITTDAFERTELYGGYAEMVHPKNPQELANTIIEIIQNYSKYSSPQSQKHRIDRAKEFDWKNISKRYERLFRKLIT